MTRRLYQSRGQPALHIATSDTRVQLNQEVNPFQVLSKNGEIPEVKAPSGAVHPY